MLCAWGCAGPAPASLPGVGGMLSAWDWEELGGPGSPAFSPCLLHLMQQAQTGEGKGMTAMPRSRVRTRQFHLSQGFTPRLQLGLEPANPLSGCSIPYYPRSGGEQSPSDRLSAPASAGRAVRWLVWLKQSYPRTKKESLLVCEAASGPAPALLPGVLAPQPGPLIGNRSPR